ncbi:MAG TPA: Rieske (2Fe-2S) protein [Pseudonocardiaceae bacterium]|nr:Rieske (2Fe-2S) protein [Pseudonocardiaceae bacterium]
MTSTESAENTDNHTAPRRRSVLCGVAVALLVPGGLAAACSGSGFTSTSSGTTTGGGSTTTGGRGSGTRGLAALADVPEGGGIVVDGPGGKKLVLVRNSATAVKAYDATCTHKGSQVGAPASGVMTCPSHGSQFDAATGAVKKGPAVTALAEVQVTVQGDQVVLA